MLHIFFFYGIEELKYKSLNLFFMPYNFSVRMKQGKKKFCMTSRNTGKTYCYDSEEKRKEGARIHEAFSHGFKPTRQK